MAATPKPVRKEAKKIGLMLKHADKAHPALKEDSRSKPKQVRKEFSKMTAKLRLASKGKAKK